MKFKSDYQICTKTVMDTIADPQIEFNDEGVCHYVDQYREKRERLILEGTQGVDAFDKEIEKLKARNVKLEYDCILGISGGVDSTYLAYLLKEYDLRVLLFHFDNSWNSEIAVDNINSVIEKTQWPLVTKVVNWKQFRDIQRAFIKAGVVDIEMITDHAIKSALYKLAARTGVYDVISGFNLVSEGIMPRTWIWNKDDLLNIKDIHKKNGDVAIPDYPTSSFFQKTFLKFAKGLNNLQPFRYLPYNDFEARSLIADYFGWTDYQGKHYESVFTRFYQGYILPTKFGIDKRKAHYSSLICAGQLTREEAIKKLEQNPYEEEQLYFDKPYVLKKLQFDETTFNQLMKESPTAHLKYRSYLKEHYHYHEKFFKAIRPVTNLIKSLG